MTIKYKQNFKEFNWNFNQITLVLIFKFLIIEWKLIKYWRLILTKNKNQNKFKISVRKHKSTNFTQIKASVAATESHHWCAKLVLKYLYTLYTIGVCLTPKSHSTSWVCLPISGRVSEVQIFRKIFCQLLYFVF